MIPMSDAGKYKWMKDCGTGGGVHIQPIRSMTVRGMQGAGECDSAQVHVHALYNCACEATSTGTDTFKINTDNFKKKFMETIKGKGAGDNGDDCNDNLSGGDVMCEFDLDPPASCQGGGG